MKRRRIEYPVLCKNRLAGGIFPHTMPDSYHDIIYRLVSHSARNERGIRVVSGLLIVACGIVFAISINQHNLISSSMGNLSIEERKVFESAKNTALWIAIGSAVIHLAATFLLYNMPKGESQTAKLVLDFDGRRRDVESLSIWQTQLIDSAINSLKALDGIFSIYSEVESVPKDMDAILAPFFQEPEPRERIFDFPRASYYNAALYLFDDERGVLRSYWRCNHPEFRSLNKGLGRDWRPGVGHVGTCFEREKITMAEDFGAGGDLSDPDKRLYSSAVAIPVFDGDGVCGVCVITSNIAGQFGVNGNINQKIYTACDLIQSILSLYFMQYTRRDDSNEKAKQSTGQPALSLKKTPQGKI